MSTTPTPPSLDEAAARWRTRDPSSRAELVKSIAADARAERWGAQAKPPFGSVAAAESSEAAAALLEAASVEPVAPDSPLDLETWRRVTTPTPENPVPCCVCGAPSASHYTSDDIDASCAKHPAPPHPIQSHDAFMLNYVLAEVERIAAKAADCDRFNESDIYALTVSLGTLRTAARTAYETECEARGSDPHGPAPTT